MSKPESNHGSGDSGRKPLNWEKVRQIRHKYESDEFDVTQVDLAEEFDTSQAMISHVVNYTHWVDDDSAPDEE